MDTCCKLQNMSFTNKAVQTPVQLYRHLLKCLKKLPDDARNHYQHQIRQAYRSHADETNPVRVQQIINRAKEDSEWILKKGVPEWEPVVPWCSELCGIRKLICPVFMKSLAKQTSHK